MRLLHLTLPALAGLALAPSADAGIITLSPSDIHGDDSTTAQFSNADVTLTPLVGGVQNTFNGNANRLGIDDQGTNNNAFNDPDTDPNNGNEEKLQLDFVATAGLTQIAWDFTRAQIDISGFTSDPGASISGDATGVSVPTYDSGTGTVSLFAAGAGFNGNDTFLDFANPGASAGQSLLLSVSDPNQTGSQLAILSISYEDAVPEPGSLALLSLGGLLVARRRRA